LRVLYWSSESQLFDKIVDDLAAQFELIEFEEMSEVVEHLVEEEIDVILFDYDNDRKLIDKSIKKIKKSVDVKIFLHTNELTQKELLKHQKSKISADLYLRSPLEKTLLYSMVVPFFDGEIEILDDPVDLSIEEHESTQVLSASEKQLLGNVLDQHTATTVDQPMEAQEISKKLDEMFLSVFPVEEGEEAVDIVDEELSLGEVASEEISLDELDLTEDGLLADDTDINLMEDAEDDALLLDDETSEQEGTQPMSTDDALDLSVDDTLDLSEDLLLDEDDLAQDKPSEGELLLSDEPIDSGDDDDLLFDVSEDFSEDLINAEDESLELSTEDESMGDTSDELELSDDNLEELNLSPEADLVNTDDAQELNLGELDLSSNSEEDSLNDLELGDDIESLEVSEDEGGLDLSLDDDLSLELGDEDIQVESIDDNDGLDMDLSEIDAIEEIENIEADEEPFTEALGDELSSEIEFGVSAESIESDDHQPSVQDASTKKIADQSLEFELNSNIIDELDSMELDPEVDSALESFSDDAQDKLAEIDAMMEDSLPDESLDSVDKDTSLIKSHLANKGEVSEQLATLGMTIKTLREDREALLQRIEEVENNKDSDKRDHLSVRAELDEKSIEVNILKRRYEKKLDLLKVELDISLDKKALLEGRTKLYEAEIEKLNNKVRIDLNKVKMRERELENKLEMLRSDSESQIRNRDLKILELKRKIDTLEFDLESVQSQGKKVVTNKYELEEKMEKVIETLRGAIGDLEEDGVYTRKIKNVKKNLDV
jgi:hypothetical protein